MKETRGLSMTTLNDTEVMRHTVVIQKAGRIIPIDHLVDTRPERVEKPHADKSPDIGSLDGDLGIANT
jgi:hypothetical protein